MSPPISDPFEPLQRQVFFAYAMLIGEVILCRAVVFSRHGKG